MTPVACKTILCYHLYIPLNVDEAMPDQSLAFEEIFLKISSNFPYLVLDNNFVNATDKHEIDS